MEEQEIRRRKEGDDRNEDKRDRGGADASLPGSIIGADAIERKGWTAGISCRLQGCARTASTPRSPPAGRPSQFTVRCAQRPFVAGLSSSTRSNDPACSALTVIRSDLGNRRSVDPILDRGSPAFALYLRLIVTPRSTPLSSFLPSTWPSARFLLLLMSCPLPSRCIR
ncbi:hypothetical protein VTN00DRAFT_470 [Thermoascus crustaceus]|uniref:uncharacterized protein n=1 Tax=Thermoascus crustaceus TaxID=5088 RepID=UPI00374494E9